MSVLFLFLIKWYLIVASSTPIDPTLPTPYQATYISWEFEMFAHFSITTYTGSQSGTQNPALFTPDPDTLNISQWVETAKKMGAKVLVLTSKHEAGFCLWPSKYSNYTIEASPTVGDRDFVREFINACHEQEILPGLYYTTGSWKPSGKYGTNFTAYNINQATELMTQYGDIAYWWFDHHNNDPIHEAIDKLVRKHQPRSVMLGPDSWLTGEETGFAAYPLWYACNTTDATEYARCTPPGSPHGLQFKSWESDCSFFNGCHPWFCGNSCPAPQNLHTSMQHWENTYGRGVNYILNIPPNKHGFMDDALVKAAGAFRDERERRYGDAAILGYASTTASNGTTIAIISIGKSSIDRILLEETSLLTQGQRVASYTLEALTTDNQWVKLQLNDNAGGCVAHKFSRCGGSTIGSHHIDIIWPAVEATKIRFTLGQDYLPYSKGGLPIVSLKVFATGSSP